MKLFVTPEGKILDELKVENNTDATVESIANGFPNAAAALQRVAR